MNCLLPPNAKAFQKALSATEARLDDIDVQLSTLWDPWRCPEPLLPWLAWSLSVDVWNADWPENVKRQVIDDSFDVHRRKGTPGAVKRALRSLDLDGVTLAEWFDYAGDPGYFRVDVELSTRGLTDTERADILDVIDETKNVRSWLDRLRIYLANRSAVPAFATAALCAATITVYPMIPEDVDVQSATPAFASIAYADHVITVYPQTIEGV